MLIIIYKNVMMKRKFITICWYQFTIEKTTFLVILIETGARTNSLDFRKFKESWTSFPKVYFSFNLLKNPFTLTEDIPIAFKIFNSTFADFSSRTIQQEKKHVRKLKLDPYTEEMNIDWNLTWCIGCYLLLSIYNIRFVRKRLKLYFSQYRTK